MPFVTAYPDVTIKDLTGYPRVNFKKGNGFFVKYIIKTPPQTFGKYVFTVNTENNNFKVCRLLLLYIGDNYPCTRRMPKSPTGFETTVLNYGSSPHSTGEEVTYEFKVG